MKDKTNCSERLDDNNFVVLRELVPHKEAVGLAEGFLKYCIMNGIKGDVQAPNSPSVYDYKPFLKLMLRLLPTLNELLNKELFPTYCYARVYSKGEILERHRDREACEHSVTLNLFKGKDWPIWMQSPDESEHSVELNPGDGILYKGCEADHWREAYKGDIHIQLFMHYVDSEGPNSWAYFDKRKG